MIPEYVTVHRRAATALDVLASPEQQLVWTKFNVLRDLPTEQWAQQGVRRLKPSEPIYLVRGAPNLLVFFSVLPDGRFLIEDFVRQETLDRFFAVPQEMVGKT